MNNVGISYPNGFILPSNYGQVPVFHPNYSLQNLVSSNTPIPSNLPLNSIYSGGLNNANYFSNPTGFPPNSTCTFTTTTSTANISDLNQPPVSAGTISDCESMQSVRHLYNQTNACLNSEVPMNEGSNNVVTDENSNSQNSHDRSHVSNDNTRVEPTAPANNNENGKKITFINTVLSYMKSESMRKDQHSIIDNVIKFFTLEELLHCRKQLFLITGCKKYTYRPPNDPATTDEKAKHCIRSIISKCEDLVNSGIELNIVCDSDDIFRISHLLLNKDDDGVKKNEEHEKRLAVLELKVKILEKRCNTPVTSDPAPIQFPPLNQDSVPSSRIASGGLPSAARNSRSNLLSDIVSRNMRSQVPGSVKRRRTSENTNDNWSTVQPRRRNNDRRNSVVWGSNNKSNVNQPTTTLKGAQSHEIFLCNFENTASEEEVAKYFKECGVNFTNVKQASHPDSYIKSFVMKVTDRNQYDLVCDALPPRCGARWFKRRRFSPDQNSHPREFTLSRSPENNVTPARQIRRQSDNVDGNSSPQRTQMNTEMVNPSVSRSLGITNISREDNAAAPNPNGDAVTSPPVPISPAFRIGGPVSITTTITDNDVVSSSHLLSNQVNNG